MGNQKIERRIEQLEQKTDIAPPLIVVMWQPEQCRKTIEEQEGKTLKILHSDDLGRHQKNSERR